MNNSLLLASVCALLAFVVSAWVNAISRLTMARARRLQAENQKKGNLLVEIAENPRPYVTSALLVMLLARVTVAVVLTSIAIRLGLPMPKTISVLVGTFLLFQLVELAPRSWVLERPDQVTLLAARPVWLMGKLLSPISLAMVAFNRLLLIFLPGRGTPKGPLTSEEEIKSIIEIAESEEVIETEEREMLHSIFEFGDTLVREVMVPRPDMVSVDVADKVDDALDLMLKHGFSRVPLIDGSIDDVQGIVYLKDLVRRLHNGKGKPKRLTEVARDAVFVPEFKKVSELLAEMRQAHTHLVIVVDEYGGVSGLVTLEDLLEEIVGEIADEYDREEPTVVTLDDGSMRIDARLGISELNDLLRIELPHEEWDSVGGLIGGMLGRVAQRGDEIEVDGLRFKVEKTKGRRVAKVLVSTVAADEGETNAS